MSSSRSSAEKSDPKGRASGLARVAATLAALAFCVLVFLPGSSPAWADFVEDYEAVMAGRNPLTRSDQAELNRFQNRFAGGFTNEVVKVTDPA